LVNDIGIESCLILVAKQELNIIFLGASKIDINSTRDKNRKPRLRRRTSRIKQRESMTMMSRWIKWNRDKPLAVFMKTLKQKLQGFSNYFGLPDNSGSLNRFYGHVIRTVHKWLNRRSQRKSYHWKGLKDMLNWFGIKPMRVWKRPHVIADWY